MRVVRCESCSTKLGDLSLRFTRSEITRDEWAKRAYQGVQRHHPTWTLSEVGRYVIVRAPFYPFGDPARHRYPGERVSSVGGPLPEPERLTTRQAGRDGC